MSGVRVPPPALGVEPSSLAPTPTGTPRGQRIGQHPFPQGNYALAGRGQRQEGCRTATACLRCAKTSPLFLMTLYRTQPRIFLMQPMGKVNVGPSYTLRARCTRPCPLQKTCQPSGPAPRSSGDPPNFPNQSRMSKDADTRASHDFGNGRPLQATTALGVFTLPASREITCAVRDTGSDRRPLAMHLDPVDSTDSDPEARSRSDIGAAQSEPHFSARPPPRHAVGRLPSDPAEGAAKGNKAAKTIADIRTVVRRCLSEPLIPLAFLGLPRPTHGTGVSPWSHRNRYGGPGASRWARTAGGRPRQIANRQDAGTPLR